MSETDATIVPPKNIRIEPATEVSYVSPRGNDTLESYYVPPAISTNGNHLIIIERIEPEGATTKSINRQIQIYKNIDADQTHLDITKESIDKIIERLSDIKYQLQNSPQYRKDTQQLVKSHEETHRMAEVRFHFAEIEQQHNENAQKYLRTTKDSDAENVAGSVEQQGTLFAVYNELAAILGGVRNDTQIPKETKIDFLLSRTFSEIAEIFKNHDPEDLKKYFRDIYPTLLTGGTFWIPIHLLSYLMLFTKNADLVSGVIDGSVSESHFVSSIEEGVAFALNNPERNLSNIFNNNDFALRVDERLMDANSKFVQGAKEIKSRLKKVLK